VITVRHEIHFAFLVELTLTASKFKW